MAINTKVSKIQKFSILQDSFSSFKIIGIVFVVSAFVTSTIHAITESPIIISKYLPFSQVYALGFQINLFHKHNFSLNFVARINICRCSFF